MTHVSIVCRLGRLRSSDARVVVKTDDADRNSSRWIFDVEHDTEHCAEYSLELLDFGTGKPKTNVRLSSTFTPLDRGGAEARLRSPNPDVPSFEADKGSVIRYRVTIDATNTPYK